MNKIKRYLAMLLVLIMVVTSAPIPADAASKVKLK